MLVLWRERLEGKLPSKFLWSFVTVISNLMQLISWNIRGLGNHVKKRFLSNLLKKGNQIC